MKKYMDIASIIDHTLLRADATEKDVAIICDEALEYGFAAVAINPANIRFASDYLRGSKVAICAPIGFPLGANTTKTKIAETVNALENGATEIDMVINIGALKSKELELVRNEIIGVKESINGRALFKVILETCMLTDEEKIWVCKCAQECGADFVKTSTGVHAKGATVEDVMMMRQIVGPKMGVKAAGGIKTYEQAIDLVKAGANRIGTSSSVAIIKHYRQLVGNAL